jgi:F-type H+-transporting ATPase subunit b
MISFSLLATEGSGFGLNFDLLETNLINLAIIWGVLFYFGSKFLGNTLSERRGTIEDAILDAERRQQEAKQALETQNKNLVQAQSKAKEIIDSAKHNATKVSEEILAQAQVDVEKMKVAAAQDVTFQQEKVIRELRQRVAQLSLEQAEAELPARLTPELQTNLIDKSIALLGE